VVPTAENTDSTNQNDTHFDVVVVGGGPGGYASALYGASAGLRIALIEKSKIGGTCLHVGCIPAKALLETAAVHRAVASAADFGVNVNEPSLDFGVTQDRKQGVVNNLTSGLSSLLKGRKVTVFDGLGRLGADHQSVQVSGGSSGEVTLSADAIILATGSIPRTIPGFDVDGEIVLTSDEILSLRELPETAVVIGGGAIGCEFASMMSDLGTKVTILEAAPKILPGVDRDAAQVVERSFKRRGIEVKTGVPVHGHYPHENGTLVNFGEGESIDVSMVVVSVGRQPLTEGLGLDATGVGVSERGFIEVDENCRTAVPGVWAVGDVIATPQLAHVAFAEGMVAIRDILGEDPQPIDYGRIPLGIYCHPEVASAGHSEESAKEAGFEVKVSKQRFAGNGRAMIIGDTEGLVKIIAERLPDGSAGQILGVHIAGPWATEQLGQAYLSVNWEATADEAAAFIQPHPTLSEAFGETLHTLTGRALH